MRRLFFISALAFFSQSLSAHWVKINDADYVWGPFKIYNLSLFSETGQYQPTTRPLMLSLKYAKPVDGRDFAISLARSWSNLGITLPNQDEVVDRLRKIMPNIRTGDLLSYIALPDRGYFVLNDMVIPEEFNQDFNNAVVAVWLDERVEIGRKLLNKVAETAKIAPVSADQAQADQVISAEMLETASDPNAVNAEPAEKTNDQAVENAEKNANTENNVNDEKAENPLDEQSKTSVTEPKSESNQVSENPATENPATEKPAMENQTTENQTAENQTAENKESEIKATEQAEKGSKSESQVVEQKADEPAINYPNPETEIQPPFDPIPFGSPFK